MSDDRTLSNAPSDRNDEVLQWVTYKLGEETYGINVMQVQEVLRHTEIAPVPGAPEYVLMNKWSVFWLIASLRWYICAHLRLTVPPTSVQKRAPSLFKA